MRDILTDNQTALWVDLVHEAEHDAAAPLGEELESYLVFLLIAHMRDTHLHRNAIAIDYLLAKAQAGQRHREELRTVGDRCLLLAGLYPEQARQRMVGLEYFIAMGSQAYNELAHALRATVADHLRGLVPTAYAVPDVPTETATSPSTRPSPSAAPMLSPVPADSAAPHEVRPTTSDGAATRGSATGRPTARAAYSGSHAPLAGEK